jgi:hypothetical protein
MCGIPAKKSRDRLDNGLLIDVPGIAFLKDEPNRILKEYLTASHANLEVETAVPQTTLHPAQNRILLSKRLPLS